MIANIPYYFRKHKTFTHHVDTLSEKERFANRARAFDNSVLAQEPAPTLKPNYTKFKTSNLGIKIVELRFICTQYLT